MVFKEGQHAYLDLANVGMLKRPDLFDPHTVHFHGFPQAATIFDGEPMASVSIAMGGTLRYYYHIVEPGTYLYHCHVEATEHMQMGMIGNLWVEPKQNNLPDGTLLGGFTHQTGYKYAYNDGDGSTYYDVEAALQVTGFDKNFHQQHIAVQPLPFAAMRDDYPMINGRGYPDTIVPGPVPAPASSDFGIEAQKVTSLVTAQKGQRILVRLSNVSETDIHTITVMGIPMKVVAKDARLLRGPTGLSLAYDTTSVKLGGGETTDVMLDTTSVAPGTYLLYGTRLNQLSNDTQDYGGLMTEIVITP
jgi:FtsP/CotA-like multicopper oxidase with cupredoxin domain